MIKSRQCKHYQGIQFLHQENIHPYLLQSNCLVKMNCKLHKADERT